MQRRPTLVNTNRLWYDQPRCRRKRPTETVYSCLFPLMGFLQGAVVNGFFMSVFPCIRQGALADGLYGLNPRNTFWSLRPNVRARQHCLYRQNPRKTVPRFTPCVRPACLLGTG